MIYAQQIGLGDLIDALARVAILRREILASYADPTVPSHKKNLFDMLLDRRPPGDLRRLRLYAADVEAALADFGNLSPRVGPSRAPLPPPRARAFSTNAPLESSATRLDLFQYVGPANIDESWNWMTMRRILEFCEGVDGTSFFKDARPPWIGKTHPLNPFVLHLPVHKQPNAQKLPRLGAAPLPPHQPHGYTEHRQLDALRFMVRDMMGALTCSTPTTP